MRQLIIQLLIDNGEMMLSRVADELGVTAQLAHYHLETLRKEGLVLSEKRNRKRYYRVQQAFVRIDMGEMDEILRPLIDRIAENVVIGQAECEDAHALSNNVQEALERYIAYLTLVFENEINEDANALSS